MAGRNSSVAQATAAAPARVAPTEHYRTLARSIRDEIAGLKSPEAHSQLTSLAVAYELLASRAADREARLGPPSGFVFLIPDVVSLQPLDAAELSLGETYDSWRCQACQEVLALAPRATEADPLDLPDAIVRLRCPRCDAERHYTIHDRRVRRYPFNAKATARL